MGKIKRRGGLYPNKSYLEGYAKKLWIALEPTACCYVSVDSTGIETTYYLDVAYRKINDVDEPNDIQSWDEQQRHFSGRSSRMVSPGKSPFPREYWKVQVTNYYSAGASGYPSPHGKGNPPRGYMRKYDLGVHPVR